jgi:response regulator of citrate/malate metabolism
MILSCVIADSSLELQSQYAVALSRVRNLRLKETVTSGGELEDCLQRGNAHLVLLDIFLCEWGGLNSLRQARIRYPRIDWLVLSSGDDTDIVRGCICLGVFDYLIRPFSTERLERALSAYYQYHQGLTQRTNPWRQKDLDLITGLKGGSSGGLGEYPKGIQVKLLERLRACMEERDNNAISASTAGSYMGISRSTARRYLEYLADSGHATVEYDISSVGRPVKLYRLIL